MMSREEEEQRQNSLIDSTAYDDLEDDLEHLKLEEEEDDDQEDEDEDVSDIASRASSHGLGSSRAHDSRFTGHTEWQPQSFEFTGSLPASPYMRPSLSPLYSSARSYSKIQVSPRLNPQLYASPRSPSPVPDLNEISEWPLPSPSNKGSVPIAVEPRADFLAKSPSPKLGKGSWSAVAQIGGSPQTASPWASRALAPDRKASDSGSPSATPAQDGSAASGINDDEMDEELRFVLELSRAEEESRRAATRLSP